MVPSESSGSIVPSTVVDDNVLASPAALVSIPAAPSICAGGSTSWLQRTYVAIRCRWWAGAKDSTPQRTERANTRDELNLMVV